jgi:hypothetical protein
MGGLGLTALWLAGSARTRAGSWLFGAALQAAWVAYVALTGQYGLVLPCAIAVAINWRNFRTERRERATAPAVDAVARHDVRADRA